MKRVQKLLIGTGLTIEANKSAFFTNGTVGHVGVFDAETGVRLTGAETPNKIVIGLLCQDSDLRKYVEESAVIEMNTPTAFSLSAYAASKPKKVSVDLTTVSVLAGNVYELFITDYNDYSYIIGRRRISYEAKPGDVLADIVTGLVAAINTDDSIPNVTATDAGANVIDIVGKAVDGSGNVMNNFRADYEILFEIVLGENLYNVATLTPDLTTPDKGCGTFREVRKMEEIHKGYKGYLNRVIYPSSVNIQYKSVPGTNYDLYVIEHKADQYTVTEGDVHFQISQTVAMVQGQGAGLAAILDPILAQLR